MNKHHYKELSYITIKNPFWPNFLGRRQNFEKTGQKNAFFGARSPLKVSIYWRQNAFRKFLGPVTKNGYLKAVQRGTHRVGRGSTPLNPPLGFGSKLRDLNSKWTQRTTYRTKSLRLFYHIKISIVDIYSVDLVICDQFWASLQSQLLK